MTSTPKALLAATLLLALAACEQAPREEEPAPAAETQEPAPAEPSENPLLTRYLTPFQTPPFHRLEAAHFLPALEQAIEEHSERISTITGDDDPAGFANTIVALERANNELERVTRVLVGLITVSDDPELHEIAPEFSARQADYEHSVLFNRELFDRVTSVHDQIDTQAEDPEQQRLIELTHQRFVHAGAEADDQAQQRVREINARLAELGQRLDAALREERADTDLLIEDETQLEGLPETLVNLAARSARERGHPTGWVFTLHEHNLQPFLAHFPEREQRQAMFEAWIEPYASGTEWAELAHETAQLRAERAELLGFDSHLDYRLAGSTIDSSEQLRELLDALSAAASNRIADEMDQVQALAEADGLSGDIEPWDWWYYRERLRESEIGQTDAELRDWFTLEQVRDGAFALANRLWGLSFHVRTDLPLWYTDVETWEVRDSLGEHLGVIYLDYLHREGKRAGNWTFVHRPSHRDDDERVTPVVANAANFPRAAAGLPSLLSAGEVETLFRQFGRALHELLSDTDYPTTAASALPADFAEFMGRLVQRWALQPEVLRMYAYHHETGGMITDEAIEGLGRDQRLLSAIESMQQVAAIELDLALHDVGAGEVPEIAEAIESVHERLGLPASVSAHFHGGGPADLFAAHQPASHEVLWALVLASDAFAAFEEATVLDRNLAEQLKDEILVPGNTRAPMESWRAFRDRDPQIEHLLNTRGLGD
ncbi:M3 family metallopeptidase [Wenzhouxiangella sp. AB-CW3]|uniref:M3 family metallopeptidase n=1 Tax=Wenzhouxiangella sp. AB-CW3 TaxID=2771012 RepID=UPI00168B6067|nr:M3 family metallopeptidase [Wenzhouxiangella sp. AB-CW3]QOC21435.1 M3 family metallopeptidase [Wenzhouxiangella sp. AB-CW3]